MRDPKQLLREVVMRSHLMFPENPQDEIWFDEGIKNQHKLFADIVDTLELGDVKTPGSINTKRTLEVLKQVTSHETIDLTKPREYPIGMKIIVAENPLGIKAGEKSVDRLFQKVIDENPMLWRYITEIRETDL